jgi:putative ABC transport system permease protein
MVLGITLGVAVAVAIDLANVSASRAFDLSTEAVAGRATHQIVGGPEGLDETLYTQLKLHGVSQAAPVITQYVSSPQLGNNPMQLLGIDPFADAAFRSYLSGEKTELSIENLAAFLTQPDAIFLSSHIAERFGLRACLPGLNGSPQTSTSPIKQPDCHITLVVSGIQKRVMIAGILSPSDSLSQRALDGILLTDISTAQELTGRLGRLDRIDLIIPETSRGGAYPSKSPSPEIDRIQAILPASAHLQAVEARTGTLAQMTAAFRLNLTALSLLALVVGLFLIYNTMTFSVVQRRQLFGTLRCLGVTRQEVFWLVAGEAVVVGILGSLLGAGLGILLGQGAVRMVTQTINDLFFVVTVRGVQIPASSLVKGTLLGVVATLLTAIPPAWEAASVPPRAALTRSGLESKTQRAVKIAALSGLVLLLLGAGFLLIPTNNLIISFAGTFAIIIGFALLAPIMTALIMRASIPPLGRMWGSLGRMAPRDVISTLSRTSIAVAALMVAVSVTIGVGLMVSSFRHTVIIWLNQTLQGDIYINAPGLTATTASTPIEPSVLSVLKSWPGVEQVFTLRSATVESPNGPVRIAASSNPDVGADRLYLAADGSLPFIRSQLAEGSILVSEPFANRFGLPRHGGEVTLYTDNGPKVFPVVGIYYDYASTQGTVMMSLDVYRQLWHDDAITSIAIYLVPGSDVNKITLNLQNVLSPIQELLVRPNQVLRQEVLAVFDRTFAITGALQLLATLVAFIGILSALLSLELERQRELGILRAVGLTIRQLWGLVMLETGLLGAVAGLLAMPTGVSLAMILVFIINRRSFGWTLQMQVLPEPFLQALGVAVIAALLAGIYPARRMSKIMAADAIRYE